MIIKKKTLTEEEVLANIAKLPEPLKTNLTNTRKLKGISVVADSVGNTYEAHFSQQIGDGSCIIEVKKMLKATKKEKIQSSSYVNGNDLHFNKEMGCFAVSASL